MALSLGAAAGCGVRPQDAPLPARVDLKSAAEPVVAKSVVAKTAGATAEPAEQRTRWVYDHGYFAKGVSDAWYEHNKEAMRIRGKAWEFRQTSASKDYVELYDASRGVAVRLWDLTAEARWDKDGKDAQWQPLLRGAWETGK